MTAFLTAGQSAARQSSVIRVAKKRGFEYNRFRFIQKMSQSTFLCDIFYLVSAISAVVLFFTQVDFKATIFPHLSQKAPAAHSSSAVPPASGASSCNAFG